MAARKEEWGWIVDFIFTHADGRKERVRKKSPVQTRRGAEKFERQLRQELLRSLTEKPKKEVPTLGQFAREFIDDYAKNENKPSEVKSKEGILSRYLIPILGSLPLDKIGTRQIARLKSRLRSRKLSDKTIKNALAVLGKMLRWAEECEIIEQAPRIKMPRVPLPDFDFLEFEEAARLLEAATAKPDWHAMVHTALKTGLRYGELCELRWSDVDLDKGSLLVRRSYTRGHVSTPKNGRPREVPLSPAAVEVLWRHRHAKGELVFCKPDGGRRIHRRADVAIKKLCQRAGLRLIGWHTLRHSFASHLAMRGVPLKAIQEMLGHATMDMTLRYAHLTPQTKRDAVAVLDDLPPRGSSVAVSPEHEDQEEGQSPETAKSRTLASATFH